MVKLVGVGAGMRWEVKGGERGAEGDQGGDAEVFFDDDVEVGVFGEGLGGRYDVCVWHCGIDFLP